MDRARGFFARRGYVGEGIAIIRLNNLMDFWICSIALRSLGLTTIALASHQAIGEQNLREVRCVVANPNERWPELETRCAALGYPLVYVALLGESALPSGFNAGYPEGGHILQTSGTTGSYKMLLFGGTADEAVRNQAKAFGANRDWMIHLFGFGGWTAAGYMRPLSVWGVGGGVIMHQREPHEALRYREATHATLLPETVEKILAAPEGSFPRSETLQVSVGGGALTSAQIAGLESRVSPILHNQIGSTEVGGFASTPLNSSDDHRWHMLLPFRVVEIVDEQDQPVPEGKTGRLRVATAGFPTSYLDNPDASREFFRDGFFYPGDLAVQRADGRIALQGRVTDVINIKGNKVSPAPLEDRLREALRVSDVCLFSAQDSQGEEQVHVVIETNELPDPSFLNELLKLEFPGSAVVIQYSQALPRTGTGKVMRSAVREQCLTGTRLGVSPLPRDG